MPFSTEQLAGAELGRGLDEPKEIEALKLALESKLKTGVPEYSGCVAVGSGVEVGDCAHAVAANKLNSASLL